MIFPLLCSFAYDSLGVRWFSPPPVVDHFEMDLPRGLNGLRNNSRFGCDGRKASLRG